MDLHRPRRPHSQPGRLRHAESRRCARHHRAGRRRRGSRLRQHLPASRYPADGRRRQLPRFLVPVPRLGIRVGRAADQHRGNGTDRQFRQGGFRSDFNPAGKLGWVSVHQLRRKWPEPGRAVGRASRSARLTWSFRLGLHAAPRIRPRLQLEALPRESARELSRRDRAPRNAVGPVPGAALRHGTMVRLPLRARRHDRRETRC